VNENYHFAHEILGQKTDRQSCRPTAFPEQVHRIIPLRDVDGMRWEHRRDARPVVNDPEHFQEKETRSDSLRKPVCECSAVDSESQRFDFSGIRPTRRHSDFEIG
jgi:hypothetical protein